MDILNIKETSEMLSEFEFAGVDGEICIEFDFRTDDFWDHDDIRIKLYDDLSLNPEIWNEELWTKWIKDKIVAFRNSYKYDVHEEGIEIRSVYIVYPAAMSTGYNPRGTLCEAVWDASEKCWTGAYAYAASRDFNISGTHITLREFDIKSSDDIMNIVCQLTDIESHDFCVV